MKKILNDKKDRIRFLNSANRNGSWEIGYSLLELCEYDLDLCFFLTDLIQVDKSFGNKWFFNQRKIIQLRTGFSFSKQQKITNKLVKMGFMKVEKRGTPAKNHYKILYKNISKKLLKMKKRSTGYLR